MSKFEYGSFVGGDYDFAVNSEKYSEAEAVQIFEEETLNKAGFEKGMYGVHFAYVRWGFGVDDKGDRQVGWWLEETKRPKGSCKVYAFSVN